MKNNSEEIKKSHVSFVSIYESSSCLPLVNYIPLKLNESDYLKFLYKLVPIDYNLVDYANYSQTLLNNIQQDLSLNENVSINL
jgi:hypothetical protein